MSSHTQAIAMLGKPLTDAEAEQLMSKRISFLRSEEHEAWHRFFKRMAGQPSESVKIAMQFRRDE